MPPSRERSWRAAPGGRAPVVGVDDNGCGAGIDLEGARALVLQDWRTSDALRHGAWRSSVAVRVACADLLVLNIKRRRTATLVAAGWRLAAAIDEVERWRTRPRQLRAVRVGLLVGGRLESAQDSGERQRAVAST